LLRQLRQARIAGAHPGDQRRQRGLNFSAQTEIRRDHCGVLRHSSSPFCLMAAERRDLSARRSETNPAAHAAHKALCVCAVPMVSILPPCALRAVITSTFPLARQRLPVIIGGALVPLRGSGLIHDAARSSHTEFKARYRCGFRLRASRVASSSEMSCS
jgi:hypothetical protein